jgi:hypothetical protein
LHDLDSGLDRGAQVGGAGGDVSLEEVVVKRRRITRVEEFTPRRRTV